MAVRSRPVGDLRGEVAVFEHVADAERAAHALGEHGISADNVRVVSWNQEQEDVPQVLDPHLDSGTPAEERGWGGLVVGAIVGALLGAGLALLGAMDVLELPGPEITLVPGWIAVIIIGAAAGIFVASLAGSFSGLRKRNPETRWYEDELRQGRALLVVQGADRPRDEIHSLMLRHGALRCRTC